MRPPHILVLGPYQGRRLIGSLVVIHPTRIDRRPPARNPITIWIQFQGDNNEDEQTSIDRSDTESIRFNGDRTKWYAKRSLSGPCLPSPTHAAAVHVVADTTQCSSTWCAAWVSQFSCSWSMMIFADFSPFFTPIGRGEINCYVWLTQMQKYRSALILIRTSQACSGCGSCRHSAPSLSKLFR